ncbi:MAG TPA: type II secretion system protein GspE, partial [Thermoanaerobaculia bacterium]
MSVRLGELLTKASLITQEQLKEALKSQKDTGGKLGETLIKLGFVSEEEITECLSQQFGVPSINLSHFEIDSSVIKLIPADVARKYNILPVNKTGATITIAMADPTNVFAMDDIKFMTGYNVEPVVASELGIKAAIDNYYGSSSSLELKKVMEDLQQAESADLEVLEEGEELDVEALAEGAEEAPVVKLCNLILTDAIKRGASDIHIEPYEKEYRVRFRIDGILY